MKDERTKHAIMDEDWYLSYNDLRPYLLKVDSLGLHDDSLQMIDSDLQMSKDKYQAEIMILGSGTSCLGDDLYFYAGFENITNVDFSQTIIDYM